LGNIAREIGRTRPDFAEDYCLALMEKVTALTNFPLRGRKFPGQSSANLRELILPPYRVIYELHPDTASLDVLRVWDARRGEPDFIRTPPP
jgi:plasmid stabilization system protein ParE